MDYPKLKKESSMEDCSMKKKPEEKQKQAIRQTIQMNWKKIIFGDTEKHESFQTRRLYVVVVAVFFLYLLLSFFSS